MKNNEDPFCLENHRAYLSWRKKKLERSALPDSGHFVKIKNMAVPTDDELNAIRYRCKNFNFSFYETDSAINKSHLIAFAQILGLNKIIRSINNCDVTGITEIKVVSNAEINKYIPYTDKPLSWHTDGYYAPYKQHIQAFVLHCIRPANVGGTLSFLDPEIAYIRLRDLNPEYISTLMMEDAMQIPANISCGVVLRPKVSGPVFWVNNKVLHMRYTARRHNIIWNSDEKLLNAKNALEKILKSNEPQIVSRQMQAGQGIVCNNILHKRDHFSNQKSGRLVYRARFLDRIS